MHLFGMTSKLIKVSTLIEKSPTFENKFVGWHFCAKNMNKFQQAILRVRTYIQTFIKRGGGKWISCEKKHLFHIGMWSSPLATKPYEKHNGAYCDLPFGWICLQESFTSPKQASHKVKWLSLGLKLLSGCHIVTTIFTKPKENKLLTIITLNHEVHNILL